MLILSLSLSTLNREYGALLALPHYDCVDFVLKPQLPKPPRLDPKEVEGAMTKYNVNEPQARAIVSALRTDGFTLVQGSVVSWNLGPYLTNPTIALLGLAKPLLSVDWCKHSSPVVHNSYLQMVLDRRIGSCQRRFFSARRATPQLTR